MDEATVRRLLRKTYKPHLIVPKDADDYFIHIEKPILIQGGVAIGADLHVPLFKVDYVNEALEAWREAKLKRLIIAGDFWNQDALSAFEYKQESANLERELRVGNYVMSKILESFDEVYLTYANHDARLAKRLGYKLKFAESMRFLFGELPTDFKGKLRISNRDFINVEAGGREFRVCHPKDYSQTPCANARKMCSKYLTNVLCGHSHHSAIAPDTSGQFIAAEIGGFFDRDKTEYVQRSTSHPNWTNGYAFIENDGHFVLNAELWSTAR